MGPNYRPDPVVALGFCETRGGCTTGGTTGATASRNDSRASHSTPESAFVTSGRSTPTGVLAGAAGRPSGGKPGAAEAHAVAAGGGGAHPLYHHGGRAERGSAGSLQTAGAVSGSAADGAANLLNRQAAAAGQQRAPACTLASAFCIRRRRTALAACSLRAALPCISAPHYPQQPVAPRLSPQACPTPS